MPFPPSRGKLMLCLRREERAFAYNSKGLQEGLSVKRFSVSHAMTLCH
jgi:hypothetical protein